MRKSTDESIEKFIQEASNDRKNGCLIISHSNDNSTKMMVKGSFESIMVTITSILADMIVDDPEIRENLLTSLISAVDDAVEHFSAEEN